jgi:ketosteroid isomerase-like protein
MSTEQNVQTVKDFFAAIGRGDREALLALVADDIEWITPGWRICLRRPPGH